MPLDAVLPFDGTLSTEFVDRLASTLVSRFPDAGLDGFQVGDGQGLLRFGSDGKVSIKVLPSGIPLGLFANYPDVRSDLEGGAPGVFVQAEPVGNDMMDRVVGGLHAMVSIWALHKLSKPTWVYWIPSNQWCKSDLFSKGAEAAADDFNLPVPIWVKQSVRGDQVETTGLAAFKGHELVMRSAAIEQAEAVVRSVLAYVMSPESKPIQSGQTVEVENTRLKAQLTDAEASDISDAVKLRLIEV